MRCDLKLTFTELFVGPESYMKQHLRCRTFGQTGVASIVALHGIILQLQTTVLTDRLDGAPRSEIA